jgi:Ca2+-binding RTX toxin-like protein
MISSVSAVVLFLAFLCIALSPGGAARSVPVRELGYSQLTAVNLSDESFRDELAPSRSERPDCFPYLVERTGVPKISIGGIRIDSEWFDCTALNTLLPLSSPINASLSMHLESGAGQRSEGKMPAVIVTVSNADELMAALASASGETEIVLHSGDYGRLDLYDARDSFAKFSEQVTIKSADPSNPATFSSMSLRGVENLSFEGIKFDYQFEVGDPSYERPFDIGSSSNIRITDCEFAGDLAEGTDPVSDGFGTGIGLNVTSSSDIVIEANVFHDWLRGAIFSDVNNLTVQGNEVFEIRSDGFDFANVDNVLIEGNYMHDFRGSEGSGDHLDMIQFWTNGTTSPSTNIVIRGNILDSGDGSWTQSIFMRNDQVDQGFAGSEMFYQNVLIEDNLIYNAHSHGITVGETNGLTIQNNTILHNEDSGSGELVYVPTISVSAASLNVSVTDNIVPRWALQPSGDWTVSGNLVVQATDPNGDNYVGNLFVNALAGGDATVADLMALPGSVIDDLGIGAAMTRFAVPEGGFAGFLVSQSGEGFLQGTQFFDASNLFSETGKVDLSGATITWDFGDGSNGQGASIKHAYQGPGLYDVTATVELASGEVLSLRKAIAVANPLLVSSDFDAGAVDQSPAPHDVVVGTGVTFEEGVSGNAVDLNGATVTYARSAGLIGNTEYSVVVDFKKDVGSEAGGGRLINFSGSFVVLLQSDGIDVSITTDQGSQWIKVSNIGIQDADWHRLVLTFSGETGAAVLYLDGSEVGRIEGLEGAIQAGIDSHDLHLGNPFGAGFTGLVDNFQFYSAAMSAEQVQGLASPDERGEIPTDTQQAWLQNDPESGNGWLPGTDAGDLIQGLAGTDALFGNGGDDVIFAGDGGDSLDGGVGRDTLYGGAGVDWLHGGLDADKLYGGSDGDALFGQDGDDVLYGEDGDDSLDGAAGNDRLYGGVGIDWLFGGDGDDYLDSGGDTDALFGEAGNDHLVGGAGGDSLDGGRDNDLLEGGLGVDWLHGGSGDDILDGGEDGDVLFGHGENDLLLGGAGNDSLDAGDGDDFLDGGAGIDVLFGAAGADEFHFAAPGDGGDVVRDFVSGEDTISLRADAFGFGYTGALLASDFSAGAGLPSSFAATGAHLYLDTSGGGLWFDPTGGHAGDVVIVAGFETGAPEYTDLFLV